MSDLNQLSAVQQEAVVYRDGPQLVIAGAGSGKTRVLTHKIAYLLQQGMEPWAVLALTFTNKAAREMKERIAMLVGEERSRYLNMGTFHSVFSHILRMESETIGYDRQFTIYDQSDSRALVKTIIKELGLDEKQYQPASVADQISRVKNHLIRPKDYALNTQLIHADAQRHQDRLLDIYRSYVERCRRANAMDFDDLLVYTYQLFEEHEEVRQKYARRYQYVLVDEYQDTNRVQQAILWQLTRDRQQLCVVGDDAQSIYSFRGAMIDNILNFTQQYHQAKVFKLEQNYRSTRAIVNAANSLIKHNARQIPKQVFSNKEEGEPLRLYHTKTDKEEALVVMKEIEHRHRLGTSYDDMAILYRTNSQSRTFEECFRKQGIPYRIYGGLSFYQRKEIKDIIAYFRLVINPDDEEAFRRIINYPTRGIGNTTLTRIADVAHQHEVSLWEVISHLTFYQLKLSPATVKKVEAFRVMIEEFAQRAETEDAYQLGKDIVRQSGISKEIFSGTDTEALSRQANVDEFMSALSDFVAQKKEEDELAHASLAAFLQEVALLTDQDAALDDAEGPKLVMMTIHSAKGLEFPIVFVVGVEENVFPSPRAIDSMRALEEERRLLYVAITRAEKVCVLTCAQMRFRFGRMEYDEPSRFLKDFPPGMLKETRGSSMSLAMETRRVSASTPTYKKFSPLPSVSSSTPQPVPVVSSPLQGKRIKHDRFGIGEVIAVVGEGENAKATVKFEQAGTKQLLLKFARFTVL